MADQRNGGIAWTDETWNPIRGCTRVSQGCVNCYAESMAARFCGPGQPYEGTINPETKRWNGSIKLVHEKLTEPLRWARPRRVFVNSMSDLFHENVPDAFLHDVFAVMAIAKQHTFQVLTKRPERMLHYLAPESRRYLVEDSAYRISSKAPISLAKKWPLPNVWLGVSAEDQATANERIPLLLKTPAAVRWISAEPLLGPVDLRGIEMPDGDNLGDGLYNYGEDAGIDWVVVGGESGQHARPLHPEWAAQIRNQCKHAGIPFLFKQFGEYAPPQNLTIMQRASIESVYVRMDGTLHTIEDSEQFNASDVEMYRVGKNAAGRLLDGVLHDAYPISEV